MPIFTIECPYSIGDKAFVIYTYYEKISCDICNGVGNLSSVITGITYSCKHCYNGKINGAKKSVICPVIIEMTCITVERGKDIGMIYFVEGTLYDPTPYVSSFGRNYHAEEIYNSRDDAEVAFKELNND